MKCASDLPRSSGILLHPTSLPGPFGVGDVGPEAYRFVDFLSDTGQSLWQVLPLGPTGYGNSPYMCFSVFAGNPLLISLEQLATEGLLASEDIEMPPRFPDRRVDFAAVSAYKTPLLAKSYHAFTRRYSRGLPADYFTFCQQNAFWLDDFALFMGLKQAYDQRSWTDWPEDFALRNPESLAAARHELGDEIDFNKYVQYVFFKQWQALKGYCHQKGILIIGDMPIYAAHDSADVWAGRDLFQLDDRGQPLVIGGVPPDYFSATGQRWGNPVYRWDMMSRTGYKWWIDRFRVNYLLVDVLRLDHFRGFQAYWEIPASEPTAVSGRWKEGPGQALFEAVREALGSVEVIAEDLGVITTDVDSLRERLEFPGMRVLQMAFGEDPKASEYRPHSHVRNCVVYTATHDHNTTVGWFHAEPGTQTTQTIDEVEQERSHVLKYVGGNESEGIHWAFIRMALGSVAHMAILPLQDVLGMGTEARMNLPGTSSGNWEWRFPSGVLTKELAKRLHGLTGLFERCAG